MENESKDMEDEEKNPLGALTTEEIPLNTKPEDLSTSQKVKDVGTHINELAEDKLASCI